MTTSLVFALQHHLCHYGVGTDVASVKAEELLWHLGDVLPPPKKKEHEIDMATARFEPGTPDSEALTLDTTLTCTSPLSYPNIQLLTSFSAIAYFITIDSLSLLADSYCFMTRSNLDVRSSRILTFSLINISRWSSMSLLQVKTSALLCSKNKKYTTGCEAHLVNVVCWPLFSGPSWFY